ncbi:glycosyltransferase [Geobacter sp. SVR]|uniref:glycosyltransferase n=1 Tax=Geobacter sp. SVR TaxID=2495594 RepID=UPI00143EFAE6|nr:glycosyltransferase [Geobacter sp. SVR]BCS54938.1 glycosyl transferase family 1 [Geobacter sp. SVR]GCF86137.1 glycosyl transferase family 1 [Geobacter sp. SVR]
MTRYLEAYEGIVGAPVINRLRQLGKGLAGKRVVHVNSTREGGGVAEILDWMVPLMCDMGIDARWEVIQGTGAFFNVTKSIHNGLQGYPAAITPAGWETFLGVNRQNHALLGELLEEADIVVIHDPQPAPLLKLCEKRKGKWIWRGHIDISHPYRPVWKELKPFLESYDASIFSMNDFAHPLPHPQFIVPPSIDPLSDKNCDLPFSELEEVRARFGLDPNRPLVTQISRFDRFKDPVGVIEAYNLVRKIIPLQLVLAGGGATDDPEGKAVLDEVTEAAANDPDIHILLLPPDAHRTINALQRLADIVIQKSTKEGFGLTVTEGLWKGKPVIGGDVGGIRRQVVNYHTGFLVNTPEGAAHRIRFLLHHAELRKEIGVKAKEFIRENFLLTRQLQEYLTLFHEALRGSDERRFYV